MIVELAALRVAAADRAAFESAFAETDGIYRRARGWHSARLLRCVEDETRYVIEATWDHIEDQTVTFAKDGLLDEFLALVGSLFVGRPELLHYEPVGSELRRANVADAP
ncbi:antibiotic biosynthesis monooxygenase (plasmid) [Embleya sp. NBC_00888]|uniref:antibiotic biosynthesis monooxygenase family protein n=1 Tax=Embleya sp. NBC_00888 TaxID=2975960 RepID=UPI002F914F85|nr:antibiotic biosynthesis monooxygenase [Embleya sp. NBC_00888]